MLILLGLGNPGSRYTTTRHNVGWMVLDELAKRMKLGFQPGKGDFYVAEGRYAGRKVALVKPTTYMNRSGLAARQLHRVYGAEPSQILAIVDEFQFPLGRVQLKVGGSAGGHNGVDSLVEELGTEEFPRLRCGIGNDFGPGEMVDWVLSSFSESEREELEKMLTLAADACQLWIRQGTDRAMNEINRRGKKPSTI